MNYQTFSGKAKQENADLFFKKENMYSVLTLKNAQEDTLQDNTPQ